MVGNEYPLWLRAKAELELRRRRREQSADVPGLLDFIQRTNPRYKPSWSHRLICGLCDRVIRGEIRRLIVSIPPRGGKTEIVSRRLPAYLLGLNPDAQIIATSYSADLSSRNNRDVQRIIDSPEYQAVFPNTRLSGKNARSSAQFAYLRNNDIFEVIDHRGSYRAAGVGGGITGMGFGGEMSSNGVVGGIGLIDDYLKNRAEAESPTVREKIWEWYTSTFRTRCEDDAPIIVIATQWHRDDLIGRLIDHARSDPSADQWTVVKLPAIAEGVLHPDDPRKEGEALWPEKYPVEELLKIKSSIGSYDWSALYQQNPTPRGGGIIKDSWIRRMAERPQQFGRWVLSVDATFKETQSGSYVVIQAWGENAPDYVLFDQVRRRMGFVETIGAIAQTLQKWTPIYGLPSAVLIEDKANGSAIIDEMRRTVAGVVAITPQGSKEARLEAVSPYFESGHVLVFDTVWTEDWIQELTTMPLSPHDDQADAASQALGWLVHSGVTAWHQSAASWR